LRAPPAKLATSRPPVSHHPLSTHCAPYRPPFPHSLQQCLPLARRIPFRRHLPHCQTRQLPSHSHFLLLPCIPASLRSFCNSCQPFLFVVIVPPSFPSRARHHRIQLHPLLTEGPDALAPAPPWPLARPPPKSPWGGSRRCSTSPKGREQAPGFALNPKSLNIAAAHITYPLQI
jgi:hypothetical protein